MEEEAKPKPKHFSMIRDFHIADVITIANGFCGVGAIFQAMKYSASGNALHLYVAAALIPLAIIFDFMDGRVARWRHRASSMGRELDSLADVISFGAAPAAIAYAAGLTTRLDQIILIFFAAGSISRLARYNITAEQLAGSPQGKVKYFEGTPVPLNIIPLAATILAFRNGNLYPVEVLGIHFHLLALLFFAFACSQISKTLHIPKP